MIHCGDSELDPSHPALSSYLTVKGNCDFYGEFKDEVVVPVGSKKLFFTHGHLYGIKQSLLNAVPLSDHFQFVFKAVAVADNQNLHDRPSSFTLGPIERTVFSVLPLCG